MLHNIGDSHLLLWYNARCLGSEVKNWKFMGLIYASQNGVIKTESPSAMI